MYLKHKSDIFIEKEIIDYIPVYINKYNIAYIRCNACVIFRYEQLIPRLV